MYGNLNLYEINKQLLMCQPAFQLLFSAGFNVQYFDDNEPRLIWRYTTENMSKMRNIYQILQMNKDVMNEVILFVGAGHDIEQAINFTRIAKSDRRQREKIRMIT